ncbi:hypothetical protein [Lacticaseibacillus kribbianus]|uniref:hypothetical protein n=1 Tax=Lacticaseibacillus kribbianus TaxID=2926292 RepID=UPI001CD5B6D8|nr:hypothetical protein [Lacticaseibacillus kribbianus]
MPETADWITRNRQIPATVRDFCRDTGAEDLADSAPEIAAICGQCRQPSDWGIAPPLATLNAEIADSARALSSPKPQSWPAHQHTEKIQRLCLELFSLEIQRRGLTSRSTATQYDACRTDSAPSSSQLLALFRMSWPQLVNRAGLIRADNAVDAYWHHPITELPHALQQRNPTCAAPATTKKAPKKQPRSRPKPKATARRRKSSTTAKPTPARRPAVTTSPRNTVAMRKLTTVEYDALLANLVAESGRLGLPIMRDASRYDRVKRPEAPTAHDVCDAMRLPWSAVLDYLAFEHMRH